MDAVESKSLGALLRTYRQEAELTREALAGKAGLSAKTIGSIESDKHSATRESTIACIMDALQLLDKDRALVKAAWRRHVRQARTTEASPDVATVQTLLVGRSRELDLLDRHLNGKRAAPPVLMLAGEPGIGKTRLLQEAEARAVGSGWRVLRGGCQRRGGGMPYTPLLDALKRHVETLSPADLRAAVKECAGLARLLPELAAHPVVGASLVKGLPPWPLSPEQERRLMFAAVARFLANVAGPAGTLLLLDDLQWAGQDALDLLLSLLRAESNVPLRVAGAYRDSDAPPGSPLAVTLADLAHTGRVAHHALAPLSPAEAGQLFDLLAGDGEGGEGGEGTDAARARAVRRCGGVPFYLVSLAQAPRQGEPNGPAESTVPWNVAQSLRQRVAALPDPAPEVLGVVAVVGRQATIALLAAVTGQPEEAVLGALERAVRARLLDEQAAGVYRFAHDVIRETVEADLGASRRTVLHRRVATTLEERPGEPPVEDLAYHYSRSDADDKAVLYLERAGDRAEAQGAHAAAEGYYRELAARLDRLERCHDAARAREKLGTVLRLAQRFDAALRVLEEALETYLASGDQPGLGRVVAQIGHVHIDKGAPNQAAERTEAMLRSLDGAEAWQGVAALYKTLALFFVAAGRYQEQLSAAERAGEYGRKAGDGGAVANGESARGDALTLLGRLDEAVPVLEGAILLAKAVGDRDCLIGTFGHLAWAHLWRGKFNRSHHYIGLTSRTAEELGSDLLIRVAKLRRALLCLYEGDWTQAHADLDWAASLDEQVESPWIFAYPVFALGALCFFEGEWGRAAQHLRKSITMATRAGVRDMKALRWAWIWLAERALRGGRPEGIREARDQLAALGDRSGQQELDVTALLPRLAWTHLELGDSDTTATMATESVERARAQGHRVALVDALWVRGMVATRRQHWEEATQALEEGLALAHGMPYPYAEACMLETDGLMRRARGENEAACRQLAKALEIFERLGARQDIARVERELARL